eukprot:1743257-Pyramimonas_sp.AAC.1
MEKKANDLAFETYTECNVATGRFAACFDRSSGSDIAYGTLSHSHLRLALRAIVAGARWPIPAGMELAEEERARLQR